LWSIQADVCVIVLPLSRLYNYNVLRLGDDTVGNIVLGGI